MTGARGPARPGLSLARVFNKLMPQLHLVGEPQGRRRHINLFSGGVSRPRQHRRFRPLAAAARRAATSSRRTERPGWPSTARTMLSIALELAQARTLPTEDMASKFFEHFVAIVRRDEHTSEVHRALGRATTASTTTCSHVENKEIPLRSRCGPWSGLAIPLFAVGDPRRRSIVDRLPGFKKRMRWFLENRKDLAKQLTSRTATGAAAMAAGCPWLAIPSRERLERMLLGYMLDEREFLAPGGIRSLSRDPPRASRTCSTPNGERAPRGLRAGRVRRPVFSAATRTGGGRSGSR